MGVISNVGRQTVISIVVISLVFGSALVPVATDTAVAQQTQPDADNTVTRIEVFENGSAQWTIQIRTRLDTDQRVSEYTTFQSRFRNDTAQYLGPFRSRMQGVVANAANATGRQMRTTDFTASTSIQEVPRRWGVVTYEFTWTNFAAQEDGRVIMGDIFQGGFFIAANDSLQVVAPDGYDIARVDPDPDSRETNIVTWNGREDFADSHPRVVFTPATGQGDERSAGSTPDAPTTGDGPLQNNRGLPIFGFIAILLLGLGGAVLYSRRIRGTDTADETATNAGEHTGAAATTEHAAGPNELESQEAVLTDEERVRTLLDANGGRMRQGAIAEEFDWSASKTSRVIGRMADKGAIEKLQLGRENLVTLDDESA